MHRHRVGPRSSDGRFETESTPVKKENLDEVEKEAVRVTDKTRKKDMRENLDEVEKASDRLAAKKGMKKMRDNLDDVTKKKIQEKDTKEHEKKRESEKMKRKTAFEQVQGMSMVDPEILNTDAFNFIKQDWEAAMTEGPTYICDICIKWEYRKNVRKLIRTEYEKLATFKKCDTNKSEWICDTCDKAIKKNKIPAQAQVNNLELSPSIPELDDLCPIELMLVKQIIPFMFIVPKHKGAQDGLKGQCVLVPANLDKVQNVLPRQCSDEVLISLALKRRLSDLSAFNKQNIRPAFVTRALEKLVEINPFYKDVISDTLWEDKNKESDPELWTLLTDANAKPQDDETDSDDNIEGNDYDHDREQRIASLPHPTALCNEDGPTISSDKVARLLTGNNSNPEDDETENYDDVEDNNDDDDSPHATTSSNIDIDEPSTISSDEVVNIAPCENRIPVSTYSEPDFEALAFPRQFPEGKNHFNQERDVNISVTKYLHARLKSSDDRFASDPQYIFQGLHWIESTNVQSAISFAQKKHFQSEISAGQLVNTDNVKRMISDDQIYHSFKHVRGSPQWCDNMMLDCLAKSRKFDVTTFFLTMTPALFRWTNIIKIVAYQSGENLTDEDVNNMDWHTKVKYFKRNPVTVARQIDYIFKKVFPNILLSGMHPIGQILNYDDRREFQSGKQGLNMPIFKFMLKMPQK